VDGDVLWARSEPLHTMRRRVLRRGPCVLPRDPAFYLAVRAFYLAVRAFYLAVRAFYLAVRAFYLAVRAFYLAGTTAARPAAGTGRAVVGSVSSDGRHHDQIEPSIWRS
jgi:hypothetical protein